MYLVGDYVVKVGSGICRIDDIVIKKLAEDVPEMEYYVLVPLSDPGARFFIPTGGDHPQLREAMSETLAWEFIRSIPTIESSWIENDRMRERIYKDAVRSNDPARLIGIIKNMYHRRRERAVQGKKATAIDERYFSLAEQLLYTELAHAIGRQSSEMSLIIEDTIGIDDKNA